MAGRSWVKLDTSYFGNPKIAQLGRPAVLLHLALITYCAEHLTDGYVTDAAIRNRSDSAQIPIGSRSRARRQLIDAGLLVRNGRGYLLHGFLDMNPQLERQAVEQERSRWREQKRSQRHPMSTADARAVRAPRSDKR